jgi:hypothetical protein
MPSASTWLPGVEELRRVALVGRSAGYTGDDRKKDKDSG